MMRPQWGDGQTLWQMLYVSKSKAIGCKCVQTKTPSIRKAHNCINLLFGSLWRWNFHHGRQRELFRLPFDLRLVLLDYSIGFARKSRKFGRRGVVGVVSFNENFFASFDVASAFDGAPSVPYNERT
jgi:hypothetical protein